MLQWISDCCRKVVLGRADGSGTVRLDRGDRGSLPIVVWIKRRLLQQQGGSGRQERDGAKGRHLLGRFRLHGEAAGSKTREKSLVSPMELLGDVHYRIFSLNVCLTNVHPSRRDCE